MCTERKLSAIPYGNAKVVVRDNDRIDLVSYTTTVATVDMKTGFLCVYGLYSATTRKHLSAFMREYCNTDYSTAKRCATTGEWYNIYDKVFTEV